MDWKRSRRRLFYYVFSVTVLLSILSFRAVYIDVTSSAVQEKDCYLQEFEKTIEKKQEEVLNLVPSLKTMRHLSGLGSYPPRCTSKCGRCSPCKPVHVPVPPGAATPTEYYPEAWRCKCGNKLYMP